MYRKRPFVFDRWVILFLLQACGMTGESNTDRVNLQPFGFVGASNLENNNFMSFDPQVAIEGDLGGTSIAVWVKQVDADPFDEVPAITHIYAKRHNGTQWISTTDAACPADGRVENTDADGICIIDAFTATESAISPRIAMDDNGDAMVVWQQNDGTAKRVYARFFDASPTPAWGAVVELNGTSEFAGLDGAGPAIAMEPDGGGTAMAAWSQFRTSDNWQTAVRRYAGGAWATTDLGTGCNSGGINGNDDGICVISSGSSALPSGSAPVVAMDNSGRAIAAYIRMIADSCLDNPEADVDASNGARAITLGTITCRKASVYVDQYDPSLSPNWGGATGAISLNPGAPIDSQEGGGTNQNFCFQVSDGTNNSVTGLSTSCAANDQVTIGMDRSGNAIVMTKVYWRETETADDNNSGCGAGGGVDFLCNNGNNTHTAAGTPPTTAQDEWSGNAIAARRYTAGCSWAGACWTGVQFLFAHSNQARVVGNTHSAQIYNCPSGGQIATETSVLLIECQLNLPRVAMSGDGSETAVSVWERFDGTNHDVFADCFTLTSSSTCGGAAATGWRSVFATPALGTATSDSYTPPYGILNDTTVSREAYSPQIAMDSTGNGRAVWAQRDISNGRWRIYSMQFRSGFTAEQIGSGGNDNGVCEGGETCLELIGDSVGNDDGACGGGETCFNGFDPASQGIPIDGGSKSYGNPVIAMQWANPANGAGGNCPGGGGVNCGNAMTLFLESDLSTLSASGGYYYIKTQARANRWVPP